jgi:membrane-bound lytic murein transglycosylase D
MKTKIDKVDILYFSRTLKSGQVIIETLKNMINQSNVPDTFLYMAMVESKFLTTAKSKKAAAGLWQLMPKTAKHLKLTINSKIDERLDPIKSTKVAISYLQYLYSRFHKWYLVAFAYNCGETRLAKAIEKAGSDNIFVLLDPENNYLPKETRRYIRKLIVASLIAHSDAILSEVQKIEKSTKKTKLKTIKVKEGTSLKKIAASYDIPVKTLKKYNAHILKGVTPRGKKRYCIYIPEDKVNKEKSICSNNENIFTYTVKEGDTLFLISKRFNNKISAIKSLNKDISKTLPVGKKIALIGTPKEKLKTKKITFTPKPEKVKEETTRVTILKDNKTDKLIVKEQKESAKKKITKKVPLKESNKRKITKIAAKRPITNKKKEETFTYKVQKGDSLFHISVKFNNRISTLKRLNGELPKYPKVGRILTIKR